MALELFRIHDDLDLFYVPAFLAPPEQDSILKKINARKWTTLKGRRVQSHPGVLIGGTTLVKAPLDACLRASIFDKFQTLGIFRDSPHGRANHVLVNEYRSGQGIAPHEDGPVYHPLVATVTLSSHTVHQVLEKGTRRLLCRILLEPGSCLVTKGEAYEETLHGIEEIQVDENITESGILNWETLGEDYRMHESRERGTRVSLTYRDVIREKTIMTLARH